MAEPLAGWVERQLGIALQGCQPVAGGCTHRAWCLELADGRRLFAKTGPSGALPMLAAEAEGLRALAASADPDLRIPSPRYCGLEGERALLVMEWLDLSPGGGRGDDWAALGAALARLHRRSASLPPAVFGWEQDNFIGSGPQPNGWSPDWGWFFTERRLRPQLAIAAAAGGPAQERWRAPFAQLLPRLPAWLNRHGALPSLVHGDLWGGNASLLTPGGGEAGGALFDPAVYRGDREVDLAMARLFGGFPDPFFRGYDAEWPLAAGHQQRGRVYDLYHLLNHANLFGGGYWQQVERLVLALLERGG